MKKRNPLFVDSTRFAGDLIPCEMELRKVPDLLGANVAVKLIDSDGKERVIGLCHEGESLWAGRIYLHHSQETLLQYQVEREGVCLFKSAPKKVLASYFLQDVWPEENLAPEWLQLQRPENPAIVESQPVGESSPAQVANIEQEEQSGEELQLIPLDEAVKDLSPVMIETPALLTEETSSSHEETTQTREGLLQRLVEKAEEAFRDGFGSNNLEWTIPRAMEEPLEEVTILSRPPEDFIRVTDSLEVLFEEDFPQEPADSPIQTQPHEAPKVHLSSNEA